ncbi:MAG: C69 family dipeptidase [Bacteroidales bacterium]|nr:C69 family dipeptidase [Bacteroidales bacterium]MBR6868439.1 C69 family dipeptidase [Bacteroidales bacterium]
MKRTLFLSLIAVCLLAPAIQASACTNIIVTKGASADGSCMVSYLADSHQLYGELYYWPAANWPAGAMTDVYDWDSGRYLGRIPQVPHTFQVTGNINEHQLIIGETTFGGREGLTNPDGLIDYGSLIYLTLQRARTAREAIATIGDLLAKYGYASEGETFSIADTEEAWIMEIIGKGKEKGAVWVAIRIPDGEISAHANCSRIHHFPLHDPDNCIYAPDVISFARKMGFFTGKDEDFSFCDAYAPASHDTLRGCETRTWSAFRILGGENFDADRYLDFAAGDNPANKMPLTIRPKKKLTVKDIADAQRDHFEGTPFDFSEDVGAGEFRRPYRWRPMGFEVDGKEYEFERSAGTQQTGFWFVAQARGWLPDEIGALNWFGVDDSATSALTPIYVCTKKVPQSYAVGNGDMMTYSETSAFWLFNRTTHLAYLFYDRVAPELRAAIDCFENESKALVDEMDAKALKMLKAGNKPQAVDALTAFSLNRAQLLFNQWKDLGNRMLVKYMDGNIKQTNDDGSFKDNGNGKHIPASPLHPKFRERWLRGVANDLKK